MKVPKMNIQEKRKLEQLANSEIDTAVSKIGALKGIAIQDFSKKYPTIIEKKVKIANEEIKKLNKTLEEIREAHYGVTGYFSFPKEILKPTLSGYPYPKELQNKLNEFDTKMEKARGLKKDVIIKLYAGTVEAEQFLKEIANALAKLM